MFMSLLVIVSDFGWFVMPWIRFCLQSFDFANHPSLSFVFVFDMHTNRKIEHCHAYHFLEINLHRNLILMLPSDCF